MADRDLLPLALYSLLASNRSGLFLVYFPLFLVTVKGAPVSDALGLVSVAYVAASLTGPLTGRWSDRVGRRRPFLLAGELGALPAFLAIPSLPSYWLCGAGFVAAQVLLAVGSPALNAYVTDLTGKGGRGRGFGLLNATTYAGQIVGFLVVAALVGPYGIAVLFPFVAAVMVGTIAIIVFLIPDRRSPPPRAPVGWREARPVLHFSIAVSVRALGIGAVGAFFGVYATSLGATPTEVAFLGVVGYSVAAAASLPFGRLVDRIGELPSIAYGTLLSLVGIIVFLLAPAWTYLVPAWAIMYLGVTLYNPAMLSWVANLAPPGHRAEYLGIFSLVNSTLWSVGPLGGGLALALARAPGLFTFALGTTLASLLWLGRPSARPRRDRGTGPAPGSLAPLRPEPGTDRLSDDGPT